jgi:Tetratricopeptide repeat/Carbohydrate binding domain
MKRLFFSILILIVSSIFIYYILSFWKGIYLYQTNLSRETLLSAIRALPSNPDPYYRLGLFYQWDMLNVDLRESLKYLKEAIRRNPLEQEYWLNLARIYQRSGNNKASEGALKNAILVFPTGYQGRWASGNLLLQQGALEKALPHFSYILANYPNQSSMVYDVLGKAIDDSDFILERIVPKDATSLRQYLSYLYEAGDKELVQKAWQKRDSFAYQPDRSETLRHIGFLISCGELNKAYQIWKARLKEEGLFLSSESDLITNGGFEKEKILGGGFDWKIEKVPGAENIFDSSTAIEGKNSLKIVFNGKENVNFHHVYQFVSLKPDTEYVLKANMKTRAVTTKSGLKIEISGIGPAFYKASESLVGDNEWKELTVAFRTPPQSQGGLVRIRRERTDKFDRYISGTVWIDNVRLTEK